MLYGNITSPRPFFDVTEGEEILKVCFVFLLSVSGRLTAEEGRRVSKGESCGQNASSKAGTCCSIYMEVCFIHLLMIIYSNYGRETRGPG